MKCGFGGEASNAKLKKRRQSDDIEPDGEVVWSSFDHYRQAHRYQKINGPAPCRFYARTHGHGFADTTEPINIKLGTAALGRLRAGEGAAPTFSPQACGHQKILGGLASRAFRA
jgi:hypothetical protein